MTSLARAAIGIIVGIIIVLLIIWSMPLYKHEARGIVLPVDGYETAYQGAVQLYDKINAPFGATKVGSITVMYHTTTQSQNDINTVATKAKQLAAAAGGNGIVAVVGFSAGQPAPLQVAILKGQVIYSKSSS